MLLKDRLLELRTNANLSQAALAKEISSSPAQISRWENGHNFPPLRIRNKICKFFNISSNYLLGINDEKGYYYKTQTNPIYTKTILPKEPNTLETMNVPIDDAPDPVPNTKCITQTNTDDILLNGLIKLDPYTKNALALTIENVQKTPTPIKLTTPAEAKNITNILTNALTEIEISLQYLPTLAISNITNFIAHLSKWYRMSDDQRADLIKHKK